MENKKLTLEEQIDYIWNNIRGFHLVHLIYTGHKLGIFDLFIDNKLNYIQKRIQPIITDENDTILWIPGLAHSSIDLDCNFIKYSWEANI